MKIDAVTLAGRGLIGSDSAKNINNFGELLKSSSETVGTTATINDVYSASMSTLDAAKDIKK